VSPLHGSSLSASSSASFSRSLSSSGSTLLSSLSPSQSPSASGTTGVSGILGFSGPMTGDSFAEVNVRLSFVAG